MRTISFCIMLSLVSLTTVTAQETSKIPAEISLAFKTGNATDIATHLNTTVEIVLLDKEDFYKKEVAKTILKEFFDKNPVTDFSIRHQGARNDAHYAIGNLTTENGNYRVYFLLRKIGTSLLIHHIRIEPDNGR